MHLRLDGRPRPLWFRDPLDELLSEGPDDILRRNHRGNQIFKLSGLLVVGHEPYSEAEATLNHDSTRVGGTRQRDAPALAAITNRLPASGRVVIGVYDHTQSRPARHGQLDGNALGECRKPTLLDDVKA